MPEEVGLKIIREPVCHIYNNKKFYLAHGDGLGPGEFSYKFLKKLFTSKFLQWMYARIHPNSATGFAHRWSRKSRFSTGNYVPWLGEDKEHLVLHSRKVEMQEHFDFYIYGHRHVPIEMMINPKAKMIYLGDWFVNFSFAEFDGEELRIDYYSS